MLSSAAVDAPYHGPGRVVTFPDPLVQRTMFSHQFRSQLLHITDTHCVVVKAETSGSGAITVSSSGSNDSTESAVEAILAMKQLIEQSIVTNALVLHCCHLITLSTTDIMHEIQRVDSEYGIDIAVITTSGEHIKISDFASQIQRLISSSDHSLLLSQVSRFAEIKSSYNWRYLNKSGQMTRFPPETNSLLNEKYYPLCSGVCSFVYDSIPYEVDFSGMTVSQKGSSTASPIDREPPVWMYNEAHQSKHARYSTVYHRFDDMTSQEVEIAFQCGVPGLLRLRDQRVSFDFESDPMILYDVTNASERLLNRDPPLVGSHDALMTLAIRCHSSVYAHIDQLLRTLLKGQVISERYKIPPSITTPLQCLLMNMARQYCVRASVVREGSTPMIQLEGEKSYVRAVKIHLLEECQQKVVPLCMESPLSIPPQWTPNQRSDVETIPVPVGGQEWIELENLLHQSIPNAKVMVITRIQNLTLWRRYSFFKSLMHKKNHGAVNEKLLFHGTRNTDPITIISSEKGFDFRYGSEDCLWGKGAYFAVQARYCDRQFAYKKGDDKQIFVARVLTGISFAMVQPNRALKEPPTKPNSTDRYDTVTGFTGGIIRSQVYVIYDHDKAYPAYLLTYHS